MTTTIFEQGLTEMAVTKTGGEVSIVITNWPPGDPQGFIQRCFIRLDQHELADLMDVLGAKQ